MSSLYKSEYPVKDTIDHDQAIHVSYYVGATGTGKTTQISNKLTDACLSAHPSNLPIVTFIYNSSPPKDFMNTVSQSLPVNKKHLVVRRKLRNRKDCAVNPFDIKVGLIRPLPNESHQIKMFLITLFTPAERTTPYPGIKSLVDILVEQAFEIGCDDKGYGNPKMYPYGHDEALDALISQRDIIDYESKVVGGDDGVATPSITSFELTRQLHVAGERYRSGSSERINYWRARDLAHRTAMPVLSDLIGILDSIDVSTEHNNTIDTGESLIEFAKRTIYEAIEMYPCFCNFTEFSIDSARIVALGLQAVIVRKDTRNNSLFFQIARMIAISKVNLGADDVASGAIPELYNDYYQQTLIDLENARKFLVINDMRLTGQDINISQLLESDCRESRKLALELIFASQRLTDLYNNEGGNEIRTLFYVTSLFVLSSPKFDDLELFKRFFTDNPTVLEGLLSTGISKQASTYFSYVITKKRTYQWFSTKNILGKFFK